MVKIIINFIIVVFLFACQHNPDLVVLETDFGNITIKVDYENAPKHSANFIKLVKEGFYDSLSFHLLISGALIQGGDPNTRDNERSNDGFGGPGYFIEQEIKLKHLRGAVGAARIKGPANPENKSNGSQFYICLNNIPIWDRSNTVFGKVVENIEVAEKISWEPVDLYNYPKTPIYIKKAYLK